jgi:hypothetical protein
MAKQHGARQQKRAAKQKAKRLAKRSFMLTRDSKDRSVRLGRAREWPVVAALGAAEIWEQGLGTLAIARQESEGRLVFAVFLVDVYCLGVKNAFWRAGTRREFDEIVKQMGRTQALCAIAPASLVKIVTGAVEFAKSYGFRPHPDYRRASMLLEGIDPSTCTEQFTFGKGGEPFYIQGPNESIAEARAIMQRISEGGGRNVLVFSSSRADRLPALEAGFVERDLIDGGSGDDALP